MAYGVTTSRAHANTLNMDSRFQAELDRLDTVLPDDPPDAERVPHGAFSEIDWSIVSEWKGDEAPSFVGRYFLGTPSQYEIDNDLGFALWAHGEGTDPEAPERIVPLQRPDSIWRQSQSESESEGEGEEGAERAEIEATAFTAYLQRCLDIGDLELPGESAVVLVFLEAPYGELSSEYWTAWASTILQTPLVSGADGGFKLALLPAIACWFTGGEIDQGEPGGYLPEPQVRDVLAQPAPAGRDNTCFGLWAINALSGPDFEDFEQHGRRVPVFYWRSFDGSSLPGGLTDEQIRTLSLVNFDEVVPGAEDSTAMALVAGHWDPSMPVPPDVHPVPHDLPLPHNLPTQTGVDTGGVNWDPSDKAPEPLTNAQLTCIVQHHVVVRRLPAGSGGWDRGHRLSGDDVLSAPSLFVGRYLSPHENSLQSAEVDRINAHGMLVCSLCQVFSHPFQIQREPTVEFDFTVGVRRGREAFQAARRIGQPPYTPVYFAIDINVGSLNGKSHWAGVPSPSLHEVMTYFYQVRQGYAEYMSTPDPEHPPVPYYIGAYASAKVLNAVYRAGLATHFWQLWAPTFGPAEVPQGWSVADWDLHWWSTATGWRAWPHLWVAAGSGPQRRLG
jgi:hypothetical protein